MIRVQRGKINGRQRSAASFPGLSRGRERGRNDSFLGTRSSIQTRVSLFFPPPVLSRGAASSAVSSSDKWNTIHRSPQCSYYLCYRTISVAPFLHWTPTVQLLACFSGQEMFPWGAVYKLESTAIRVSSSPRDLLWPLDDAPLWTPQSWVCVRLEVETGTQLDESVRVIPWRWENLKLKTVLFAADCLLANESLRNETRLGHLRYFKPQTLRNPWDRSQSIILHGRVPQFPKKKSVIG